MILVDRASMLRELFDPGRKYDYRAESYSYRNDRDIQFNEYFPIVRNYLPHEIPEMIGVSFDHKMT